MIQIRILPLAAAVLTLGLAPAVANEGAIEARQGQFKLFAAHLGQLVPMARGEVEYDAEAASAAAANLAAVASQSQEGYIWVEGTDNASAENTRALPAIWENMDDFAQKYTDLQTATLALRDAAGTDLAAMQGALGAVGNACSACHDDYRQPQ
jgi:cytochrome c556